MRLVWYFFFSPLLSGRVKEPCQPLFLCFSQNSYGMAVERKRIVIFDGMAIPASRRPEKLKSDAPRSTLLLLSLGAPAN